MPYASTQIRLRWSGALLVLALLGCEGDPDGGGDPLCGDGVLDPGEVCDGSDLEGATCADLGYARGGVLACTTACTLDPSGCQGGGCGDGVLDPGESCDGSALGGATCASLGHPRGGVLACAGDCTLDRSGCLAGGCGDGAIDGAEACDGSALGGATCASLGYHDGGVLTCAVDCSLDPTGCLGGYCGDGIIDPVEICDGPDLSGVTCTATCLDFGFYAGELGCAADCTLEPSGCFGRCGDAVVNGPETCDGSDLGGATCASQGFHDGGEVACAGDCTLDVSGCVGGYCGDGEVNGAEACDGSDLGGLSCGDLGFDGGQIACAFVCELDLAGCTYDACGDGVVNGAEACDGSDLGGMTCADLGYDAGDLACTAGCTLDASGCTSDWACGDPLVDARDSKTYATLAIGGRCWMATNLDVGERIDAPLAQAMNGVIEKYCYGNDPAQCALYGGLYQWDEAMQYVATEGAVGICPALWRLPTDAEWKALEIAAGMDPATADLDQWRGPPAGTNLRVGGSSGFDALLGGAVASSGASFNQPTYGYYWTSTLGTSMPWRRCLTSGPSYSPDTIGRWQTWPRGYALSIRCVTGG